MPHSSDLLILLTERITMATNDSTPLTGNRDLAALVRNLHQHDKDVKRQNLLGYAFIAPAMLLYLVFNIWPLLRRF